MKDKKFSFPLLRRRCPNASLRLYWFAPMFTFRAAFLLRRAFLTCFTVSRSIEFRCGGCAVMEKVERSLRQKGAFQSEKSQGFGTVWRNAALCNAPGLNSWIMASLCRRRWIKLRNFRDYAYWRRPNQKKHLQATIHFNWTHWCWCRTITSTSFDRKHFFIQLFLFSFIKILLSVVSVLGEMGGNALRGRKMNLDRKRSKREM